MISRSKLLSVAALVLVLFIARKLSKTPFQPKKKRIPANASVLITGCDSGFGRGSSISLSKQGFKVFAGCLTQEAVKELEELGISGLRPFLLDVTKESDVWEAANMVEKEAPQGLFALVNNAGIQLGYMLHWTDLPQMKKVLDVNLYGVMVVTKIMLPSLIKAKGRIINIASIAGKVPLLGAPAYTASKHGVFGFSNTIRAELSPLDVDVITIAPGFMKTTIVLGAPKQIKTAWEAQPKEVHDLYHPDFLKGISDGFEKVIIPKVSSDPSMVVEVIAKAVASEQPEAEYYVGKEVGITNFPRLVEWMYSLDLKRK